LEDQGSVPSPTKRRKDLSHHRDYPPVAQDYVSQLGERYSAQVHRSQYKTQIQYGCPQGCCHGQPAHTAAPGAEESPACKRPARPVWVGGQRAWSDLEKKMEECAYHSLLPVVKKVLICQSLAPQPKSAQWERIDQVPVFLWFWDSQELERWAFCSNRAPKRVLLEDAGCDDPDDETTCAVCRNPRKFKGWDALLIHAQKYSKQMPWQHRGYFRALQEAIFDKKAADQKQADHEATSPISTPGLKPSCGKPCADITHKMDAEHLKPTAHWRPDILIVENEECHEVGHILQQQQGDQKPQLREVLAVYAHGDGANEQRHVFVFPASKVGLSIDIHQLKYKVRNYSLGRWCSMVFFTSPSRSSPGGLCWRDGDQQLSPERWSGEGARFIPAIRRDSRCRDGGQRRAARFFRTVGAQHDDGFDVSEPAWHLPKLMTRLE
jgi:hypothetical protein